MEDKDRSYELDKNNQEHFLQQQEEIRDLRKKLIKAEKLSTLGLLSAGIVHEIKNPLNFINNFSEISLEFLQEIKDLLPPSNLNDNAEEILILLEQLEKNLAKIQQHSGRINRIASSMLLHARGGSGQMEPTDVNQLISEFVNLAFHGMRASKNPINVDIKMELDYNINMIPLKAEDFSRVILNLCNNAFDALREKSTKLSEEENASNSSDTHAQLILRSKLNGKWIIVEVEDNGLGIPKNHQDKIFEPFFTTKNKTQGTGLGLSITKDIIESHRGELMIDSKEGYFTKFIIKIPNQ